MTWDYFLDTSALAGLTFFSDRWFREVKPLYDAGHPLHTSQIVLYEYCNREFETDPKRPKDPSSIDIDWESSEGVYQKVGENLKKPLPEFFRRIRRLARDGITLEEAVDIFVNHFEIREEAVPQIRHRFEEYFEHRVVTGQYVNQCAQDLIDRILYAGEQNREALKERVEVHESRYHESDEDVQRWADFILDGGRLDEQAADGGFQESVDLSDPWRNVPEIIQADISILVDACVLCDEVGLDYLVTGDSDILAAQSIAEPNYGISVISIADEFSPGSEWPRD